MPKSPDAFRTISEVADWLGVQAHVLRFWESKFSQVKPVKRAGGRRYYRPADMLLLGGIKQLLHEDGLTIKGAQKMLREHGVSYVADMSQALDDLTIAVIEGNAAEPEDAASDLQEAMIADGASEESVSSQVGDTPQDPAVADDMPPAQEPEGPAATPAEPEVAATAPEPEIPDPAPVETPEPAPAPAPQTVEPTDTPEPAAHPPPAPAPVEIPEPDPAPTPQAFEPTAAQEPAAEMPPTPAPTQQPEEQDAAPALQEPDPTPAPAPGMSMSEETMDAQTVPSAPVDDEPEQQPEVPQDTAAAMPSFRARPRNAEAESPSDPEPVPAAPQDTATLAPEPTLQDSAAPTETPKDVKPRVIDLPPVPPLSQIAVDPSALSALTQVKTLTPEQAQQIKPLVARLTRLRASIANPRKEIRKD